MFENLKIDGKISDELENLIKSNRLSHAVILEGANEETRLAAAKEIAKALVCKGEERPCGVCSSCKKADADSHPDIHILQKEEKAANIKVDEIRVLKAQANLLPNDGDKSVFIIAEAQTMNTQAQNALLKIFEEPSKYVSFILTCPSKSAFLETIVSRGSAYSLSEFDPFSEQNEKIQKANEQANELLTCLCKGNEFDFLKSLAVFQKDKDGFSLALTQCVPILRDACAMSCLSKELISAFPETAKMLSGSFTTDKLLKFIELTSDFKEQLLAFANYNLVLTRFCSTVFQIKNS